MKLKRFTNLKGILICSVILMVGMGFVAQSAYATNGYFTHASGVNDQALGGAGVALPQDSLDASVNPANMVFLGKRYDFGLAFFNPNRQYTVTGNPSGFPGTFGLAPGTVKSDSKWFVLPSFGANWMIDTNSSFGISIFGNGGMNTDYPTNTFGGSSPTGVDLMQLFIAPTYARKLAPQHAIGITPVLAIQRFQARGLQQFGAAGFSSDPNNLTNTGYSYSYGYGARIGYQGEIVPVLNLGLSYQTKTYMSKFDDYRGLFAEQGDFDIPSNWTAGLALKATPELTFVFDVQRINYSDVKSIANPLIPNIQTALLGNEGGAGFGWKDMTIYKIGVQWKSSKDWTWRAGYSTGNQPIRESEVLFNILAPGVIEKHVTAGFTRATADNQDLNFAVTRALSHSVTGPNPLEAPGQQTIELKMDQWQIAASYAWKF
ncbi:MAG TPA: outer membrane protein transport protein [Saprospiraceae bacterium]|nr:outer membrane protein transport protein [Saprospiraceae bacterium]